MELFADGSETVKFLTYDETEVLMDYDQINDLYFRIQDNEVNWSVQAGLQVQTLEQLLPQSRGIYQVKSCYPSASLRLVLLGLTPSSD